MPKSIVIIDSRVANYRSLIDGLTQMVDDLKERSGIAAIHLISHGSQGALHLDSNVLDSGNPELKSHNFLA